MGNNNQHFILQFEFDVLLLCPWRKNLRSELSHYHTLLSQQLSLFFSVSHTFPTHTHTHTVVCCSLGTLFLYFYRRQTYFHFGVEWNM